MRRVLLPLVALLLATAAGCGGADEPAADTSNTATTEATAEPEPTDDAPVADACSLLDEAYLDDALSDVESTFGGALDFGEPLQTPPSDFCSWKDASGAISIEVTVEPAATSETDDHTGRAYNIDVEPVVKPQDGPGEKAVLLTDTAFEGAGSAGLPYGYFFVAGDVTVFVKAVGVDVGAEGLRMLATEADDRLAGA